ncbi:hypothetical protein COW94_00720 [Candidatus Peregrinibacteria bacterium CG22_combo_CG10-13_8_21_14_all_44_10]|nr:MAG: hypothetical protein AUK45_01815 [Candidatus Peregrinibacteria bacterium CG2_30_44_17]PIP66618.1 MAG: hypothetical protein COW94_00720 [Candidatus Peregrinibacteria bacterium CG22_combo_CG10-13_8_21_14_all_44_10]PIX79955.1 MAG: hypothetical protein COZ35_02335 [Candidatus Peregrinibacteria bacterium CG_4_10_14_3_um_filter_44_21]PJB88317.1 MAG: hypothetical protein CO082_05050 [Candidatus Peregrinibacteria bacterium CG_4_9_14_0_8_um_filter_44_15]
MGSRKKGHYKAHDKYFHRAKSEGYRARSAYKLKEIIARYRIVKRGDLVLDVGAAPGSFLQVLKEVVGSEGHVIGIDLKEIEPIEGVETVVGDVFDYRPEGKFDVITSDLAPQTTGIKFIDNDDSVELNMATLEICKKHLNDGGRAVFKIFQSNEMKKFIDAAKRVFKLVHLVKPDAVRSTSTEIYVVCSGKG